MENRMDYIEDLVIARLTGNIEQKDSDFLDEMIEADEQVRKLWEEHSLIASQLKGNYNKEAAWNNIERQINRPKDKPNRSRSFLLALSTFAVIVIAGLLYFYNTDHTPAPKPVTAAVSRTATNTIRLTTGNESISIDRNLKNAIAGASADITVKDGALVFTPKAGVPPTTISTLEVPQGLDKKILLNDGTQVWVNAATKISFPLQFTGSTREVTLSGEAYFEVAKDKSRPFIVHANGVDTKVLGTHFNIKAYAGERIQASLTEGSIQASYQQQLILLKPGQAAILDGTKMSQKEFDETSVLAWMKGAYYFENETLDNISHTVDRWFGYHFKYDDPSIASIGFSGALEKAQTLEAFLDRLSSSANLTYEISGQQITLQKK